MSTLLLIVAVPALAGTGFGLALEVIAKRKPWNHLSQKMLFDVVAFTQYLTIALVLLAIAVFWKAV
jgi:hypothetical protein